MSDYHAYKNSSKNSGGGSGWWFLVAPLLIYAGLVLIGRIFSIFR